MYSINDDWKSVASGELLLQKRNERQSYTYFSQINSQRYFSSLMQGLIVQEIYRICRIRRTHVYAWYVRVWLRFNVFCDNRESRGLKTMNERRALKQHRRHVVLVLRPFERHRGWQDLMTLSPSDHSVVLRWRRRPEMPRARITAAHSTKRARRECLFLPRGVIRKGDACTCCTESVQRFHTAIDLSRSFRHPDGSLYAASIAGRSLPF